MSQDLRERMAIVDNSKGHIPVSTLENLVWALDKQKQLVERLVREFEENHPESAWPFAKVDVPSPKLDPARLFGA